MNHKILFTAACALFLCAGCGSLGGDKRENIQGTEILRETERTQESDSVEEPDRDDRQDEVTIKSVLVNNDTKSVRVEASIRTAEDISGGDYTLSGIQVLETKVSQSDGEYQFCWSGFYQTEDAYRNLKVYRRFEKVENVKNQETVAEETAVKKFEVVCNGVVVPVWLTEFAVLIEPAEDWRQEGEFYQVIATDMDGTRFYLCSLPTLDDRKPSQKKEHPLEKDIGEMEVLGNGFAAAVETEHCGICYTMREDIEIDRIEKIEIIRYHSENE